jgi:protein TonB
MKAFSCFILCCAIAAPSLLAQNPAMAPSQPFTQPSPQAPPPHRVRLSPAVAEKLLIHKEKICYSTVGMAARVTGTVVLAIEIDKHGNVLNPKVVSGPIMLQKAAINAVRKYKYKPYLLNGVAIDSETAVSIPFDLGDNCSTN